MRIDLFPVVVDKFRLIPEQPVAFTHDFQTPLLDRKTHPNGPNLLSTQRYSALAVGRLHGRRYANFSPVDILLNLSTFTEVERQW